MNDAVARGTATSIRGQGSRAGRIMRGRNNLDVSISQYLLNSQTDLSEHVRQRMLAYGAQLQVLGILAGILGTPEEQAAYREAVKGAAIGVLDRSRRQSIAEGLSPFDALSNAFGLLYKGSAAAAGAVGWESAQRQWDDIGNRALATDPERLLYELGSDLIRSIVDGAKARWNQFWTDLEQDGLLVAYGKLQIDSAFLAAEVAIDVALAAVTGGAAAAASAGLKIVGRRIAATVTEVTIRALHTAGRGVPESGVLKVVRIPDAAIDPRIKRAVLDEDLLGTISRRQDMARRGQQPNPQVQRPQGGAAATGAAGSATRRQLTRGGNTATLEIDPATGRPISASGTLRQDFGATARGDNATAVGRLGNSGDHGGHLVAHRFMGDTPDGGIAPQAGNLNTGAWKRMENEWADWTKKGYEVDYRVDVFPPGATRPDMFRSTYTVRDPRTGQVRYQNRANFRNQAGQTFSRVPFRSM